jgi:hypothetical protein
MPPSSSEAVVDRVDREADRVEVEEAQKVSEAVAARVAVLWAADPKGQTSATA